MITEKDKLPSLIDDLKNYINVRIRLIMLILGENIARIVANIITNGAILFFIALFLIFGSIALGFALGSIFDSYGLGFLMVACIYLLLALAMFLFRKNHIEKPLINYFIKQLFKNIDQDNA